MNSAAEQQMIRKKPVCWRVRHRKLSINNKKKGNKDNIREVWDSLNKGNIKL